MSDEFDPERFRELAEKAERGELTESEIAEFHDQANELTEVINSMAQAVAECMIPTMKAARGAFEPFIEFVEENPELFNDDDAQP